MRIALGIEYDGSAYHGWQRQNNVVSVQEKVEKALSGVADEAITVVCAGRTDAGVHAYEQVIHFETLAQRDERAWVLGTNANLPHDISIRWVKFVDDDFHARYSAKSRTYRYLIYNGWTRPALNRNRVTWFPKKLDEAAMQDGAKFLLGEHDFTSLRSKECQANTPVRTIHKLDITRSGDEIEVIIQANAFLHHMVRNIIGVLVEIGWHEKPVSWVNEVLEAKDRSQAGITAPGSGLYFVSVEY